MSKNPAKAPRKEMTKEEKFQRFYFIWNIAENALLIIAGILAIVLGIILEKDSEVIQGDNKIIENIILYVIAVFVILDGTLRTILLAKNIKKSESSAYLVGGFEITIGIVLMIMGHEYFFSLIINFIAVFMIVVGALFLFVSIRAIVRKLDSFFTPILEILFGAILVGLGIALLIIYHAGSGDIRNRLSFILIGVVLALAGIAMMIGMFVGKRKKAKAKKKAEKAKGRIETKPEEKQSQVEVEVLPPENSGDDSLKGDEKEVKVIEQKDDNN